MNYQNARQLFTLGTLLCTTAVIAPTAWSEEEEIIEEVVVTGDLNSLPGEDVKSIFGFNKSILDDIALKKLFFVRRYARRYQPVRI